MRWRLTDEHWFWCVFWIIAAGTSLLLDNAEGRMPDALITVIDVTSLTLSLAVANRLMMARSRIYWCWCCLIIYLTTHWVRDWLVVVVISCIVLPMLCFGAFGEKSALPGLIAYILLTAILPTWLLIRNVRRLRPAAEGDEIWRFDVAPRWLVC